MKDLFIIGTGSQALSAMDVAGEMARTVRGFFDIETPDNIGKVINGVPVVEFIENIDDVVDPASTELVIGYGNNLKKKEIVATLSDRYSFARLISPLASISPSAIIAEGSIIHAFSSIMCHTKVGRHVRVSSCCTIAHDNKLEDYVNLSANAVLGGNVHVGEGAAVYVGASVAPKISIGSWAVVGAGAVVLRNIPENVTVFGNPARILKQPADSM